MKLMLRDIETFPVSLRLETPPGAIKVDFDALVAVGRVVTDVDIQRSGEEYFCQAQVTADVTLECARCLKHFDCTLKGGTEFIATSQATYEEQHREADDDEDYVFLESEALDADISDQVRQTIILAVPMIPLCREDCKGLCPKCKVNRNEKECGCTFDESDPRWDKLRELK
jgi:uncharacterized protein